MGSGVTNFLSVVEARSLGTADIDKMSAAIDKQSAALLGLGKSGDKVNEHPGFASFADKIKQGIQDPLGAAGNMAESFLTKLGPIGAGAAAIGTSLIAASVASVSFMRGLGQAGVEIEHTGIRMGLTTHQVQDFSFAMKYAGGDMASLEVTMRKLSKEVEGGGSNLRKMGIDYLDFATGKARPVSDILIQLSERWSKMGIADTMKRDAEAIAILGKSGLTALPELMELSEGLGKLNGRVLSEDDLGSFKEMRHQVALIDRDWDFLVLKLKQGVVAPFRWVFPSQDSFKTPGGKYGSENFPLSFIDGARGNMSPEFRAQYDARKAAEAEAKRPTPAQLSSIGRSDSAIDRLLSADSTKHLEEAKKKLSELELAIPHGVTEEASKTARDAYAAQMVVVKGIEAHTKAVKDLETATKAVFEIEKKSAEAFSKGFFGDESTAPRKLSLANHRIELERADSLRKEGKSPELRSQINAAYDEQKAGAFLTFLDESAKALEKLDKSVDDFIDGHFSPERRAAEQKKTLDTIEGQLKATGFLDGQGNLPFGFGDSKTRPAGFTSPEQSLRDAHDNERRGLGLYGGKAALAGVSELDQLRTMEAMKKKFADVEYDAMMRKATGVDAAAVAQDAADQLHQKRLDAELETQQALLQMALRQKQEFQSLVVGGVEALIHGQGGSFLKSQGSRMFDQVLGNAAGMAWKDVSKLIPHSSGTAGKLLEGTMFGADPIKAATDANTLATVDNTAAIRSMAISRTGGGGGFSKISADQISSVMGGFAGDPSVTDLANLPMQNPQDMNDYAPGVATTGNWTGSKPGWGKAVGIGGAAVAGAYGAYSGFSHGGARGDLSGAGSLVGAAGTIMMLAGMSGPAAPIVAGIGLALGLIPSLMGDPKKQRSDQLSRDASMRAYTMPTGADYSMDASGRYDDYDYRGKNRAVNVTYNVSAMDSVTFRDFLIANPGALSSGITSALAGGNGEDVFGTLNRQ